MHPDALTQLDHYRLLGRSGLRVSPLCLGTMTFGKDWGWGADEETSRKLFDLYVERGGNFIDTANFYTFGTSEQYVGKFIEQSAQPRDFFVLATKYTINMATGGGKSGHKDPNAGGNHRKNMVQSVEQSLKRLKTDHLDLFWLHMWDYSTPVDELMRAFDDLVRQGKVVYLAISDTPAWKIAQLNTYAEAHALGRFIATQMEYSLVERTVERDVLPMCRELGVGFLPWSPLAGGLLTGKYTREDYEEQQKAEKAGKSRFDDDNENRGIQLNERKIDIAEAVMSVADEAGRSPAQVALNWLLTRDGITSIILGARKVRSARRQPRLPRLHPHRRAVGEARRGEQHRPRLPPQLHPRRPRRRHRHRRLRGRPEPRGFGVIRGFRGGTADFADDADFEKQIDRGDRRDAKTRSWPWNLCYRKASSSAPPRL